MDLDKLKEIHEKALNGALGDFENDVSSHIKLTSEEIEKTIPDGIDKTKLTELILIVKEETKSNKEKADAIRETTNLAEIAVSIISKVIWG